MVVDSQLKFQVVKSGRFVGKAPPKIVLIDGEDGLSFHLLSGYPVDIVFSDFVESDKGALAVEYIEMNAERGGVALTKNALCLEYLVLLNVADLLEAALDFETDCPAADFC